ncbi:uncharacterized protein LOC107806928 isoform X2 [Nicotiana tabacum]|uniref:Uncharacterized protein LOC107806928 isoform X2 n=2 Tax=Nicotiana TaxID=4085 RepID=A0A1S4BCN0_TOBAC|nr:PREDICTED: uncharacterized protein LOC104233096 isoform X2 [Nicotiana sylvestris]XP_016486685.1 PREDICTED: uncharacterized protein LOC107806928 isoform X2 [Nicotiana tabacum]
MNKPRVMETVTKDDKTLDQINKLPESLLVQIISLLPIKDAVQTSLCLKKLDGVQLPELKCKCLTIKFHITKFNLYGVASLLQVSSHVETLNIDMESYQSCLHCRYESSYLYKGDDNDLDSWISNFLFPNLKSVKIVYSTGMCCEEYDKLFEFSECLLKNAMILEKFVIIAKRRKCWNCSENCVSPYLSQLAMKLLGCPSTNFMMIFS